MNKLHTSVAVSTLCGLLCLAGPVSAADSQAPATPKGSGLSKDLSLEKDSGLKGSLTGSDLFGGEKGMLHPFLAVVTTYSDNIFNESTNEKSDFTTSVSPGMWLSYPGTKVQLTPTTSATTTPGGSAADRQKDEFSTPYQTYLMYKLDRNTYFDHSDASLTNHLFNGVFQYNTPGGLALNLADEYKKNQDPYATGLSTSKDVYQTNLVDLLASYELSELFNVRAAYANYVVDYDGETNAGRNRADNSISAYLFYKFKPKTSLFTEYKYVDVNYDRTIISSSKNNFLYGGVNWAATEKSNLKLKVGVVEKDFADPNLTDFNNVVGELTASQKITESTNLNLVAAREVKETVTPGVDYTIGHRLAATYMQAVTPKLTGSMMLSWAEDLNNGNLTVDGVTKEKQDTMYAFSPGLDYMLTDWLVAGATYSYNKRDSNFDSSDYTNNSFIVRLTGSL